MVRKNNSIKKAVKFLKILSHQERLFILCQLSELEQSVSQLLSRSSLSQSALSQHLAILRKHAIVKTRKEGQMVFYSLKDGKIAKIITALHQIYCGETSEK